jgi:hypothetical protein
MKAWLAAVLVAPIISWLGTILFLVGLSSLESIFKIGVETPSELWGDWLGVWSEWIGGWTGLFTSLVYFLIFGTPICVIAAVVFGYPCVRVLEFLKKTGWADYVCLGIVVGILTALAMAVGITWMDAHRTFSGFMRDNDAQGLFLLNSICGGASGWVFWRIAVREIHQDDSSNTQEPKPNEAMH